MLLIKAELEGQEGEKRRTDRETESAHVAKGRDGEVRCGLLKRNPGEGVRQTDTQREREAERPTSHTARRLRRSCQKQRRRRRRKQRVEW